MRIKKMAVVLLSLIMAFVFLLPVTARSVDDECCRVAYEKELLKLNCCNDCLIATIQGIEYVYVNLSADIICIDDFSVCPPNTCNSSMRVVHGSPSYSSEVFWCLICSRWAQTTARWEVYSLYCSRCGRFMGSGRTMTIVRQDCTHGR